LIDRPNRGGITLFADLPRIPSYPDLADKVAVVTGSSRGIGAATARALAANGVRVALNGRDQTAIDHMLVELRAAGGHALGVAADCTDLAQIERMREQVEAQLGPADILAAFVAGGHAGPGPTAELDEEAWRSTIDGTLSATFLTVKSFLPGMIQRGRGSIITMASSAARLPVGAPVAYAAAKAGVIMLSRHLANEVGRYGIRVNCLAPHTILTEDIRERMPESMQQEWAAQVPLGRLGAPEDVALAALFLASDSSAWITGITLDVAGGRIVV
jgi:3-oxoacyl-[acyl-carrier protein] reductase